MNARYTEYRFMHQNTKPTRKTKTTSPAIPENPQDLPKRDDAASRRSKSSIQPGTTMESRMLPYRMNGLNGAGASLTEMQQLRKIEYFLKMLKGNSISLSVLQAALSLHFMRNRSVSLKDLARSLDMTSANITSIADSLERLGVARREYSAADRRFIGIALTPEGQSFIKWMENLFTVKHAAPAPKGAPATSEAVGDGDKSSSEP